jgi:hypothetical protein
MKPGYCKGSGATYSRSKAFVMWQRNEPGMDVPCPVCQKIVELRKHLSSKYVMLPMHKPLHVVSEQRETDDNLPFDPPKLA